MKFLMVTFVVPCKERPDTLCPAPSSTMLLAFNTVIPNVSVVSVYVLFVCWSADVVEVTFPLALMMMSS